MSLDLTRVTKELARKVSVNSPALLSAMAVLGVVTTAIMAIKATPKALEILEQERIFREEETNDPDYDVPIDILDKIELTWKCYLPTVLMGGLTITSILASNHISTRRNAAFISLLGVAESTLKEYQEKVIETIGEGKEQKIRAEIAQDTLDKHPQKDSTVILTGHGKYLCFDNFSKRYFRSDIEEIKRSEVKFNQKLNREGWLNINALYDFLGLEEIELGDEFGWVAERELLEFKFDTRLAKDTEEPALVIDYRVKPYHI